MSLNPLPLLKGAFSAATGFLGGIQTYLIVGAVSAAVAFAGGSYAGYRWELGAYEKLVAADATAQTKAVQKAADKQHQLDQSGSQAGEAWGYIRGRLDALTPIFISGAPAYVTVAQDQDAVAADHGGCITYGFERLLVAGERGITPDALALPAGQSDDACTADVPSDLASRVARDLKAGYSNSRQLDALEGEVKKQATIQSAP